MYGQYPSDVTDGQWQVLRTFLPRPARLGRPPLDRRVIVNAVLYLNRTGCQWRALPCTQSLILSASGRFIGGGMGLLGTSNGPGPAVAVAGPS